MGTTNILLLFVLVSLSCSLARAAVSYDDKAFIINGRRKILISGSIHYPRSTPEVACTRNVAVIVVSFG